MEHQSSIPIELLTTSDQVSDLAFALSHEECIAVDTESNSAHRYPEQVCLVQVATKGQVYLIDSIAVDNMKPLGEVLAEDRVVKVIQAADNDIRCLNREWGFRIRNVFDTSIAARFVGMSRIGLSALIENLIGVHAPKNSRIQKSDWSNRPLGQDALTYAATDVWYLLGIRKVLEGRLEALSRSSWVSEECARLEDLRYIQPDPETAYLSVKGSSGLGGQEKAILKRLFTVRDAEARRRNRPPYYILSHETLIYLAYNPAVDLTQIPSIKKKVYPRFGKLLRAALDQGSSDTPINNLIRHSLPPATQVEVDRLHGLKKWRSNLGEQLSLDPALVWPMVVLERLARAPQTLGAELQSSAVRRWQREQFSTSLEACLA